MSSWGTSIKNAAKKTTQDQIWPVTIGGSAAGGAAGGASAAKDTINQNKVTTHINNISNLKVPTKSVGKAVVSTAVKGTGVGFVASVGVNFGYRLGQERGWW